MNAEVRLSAPVVFEIERELAKSICLEHIWSQSINEQSNEWSVGNTLTVHIPQTPIMKEMANTMVAKPPTLSLFHAKRAEKQDTVVNGTSIG